MLPGVSDSCGTGDGTMIVSPVSGSSIATRLRRAWNCRSPKMSAMLFSGPAGVSVA